ncbi:MAG: PEP-CTERM sorting domain-containing protein [Myxococcota bacterium]
MRRPSHAVAPLLLTLVLAFTGGSATALQIEDVSLTVTVNGNPAESMSGAALGGTAGYDDDLDPSDGTLLFYEGDMTLDADPAEGWTGSGGGWQISDWELEIDGDPFLGVILGVVNLTGSTQSYDILVETGVGPVSPQSLSNGSVANLLDLVVGTMSDDGSPLYEAELDGVPLSGSTLVDDPFSVSGTLFSPGHIPGDSFSGVVGPAVTSTIGIRFRFELEPFSKTLFTAKLNVVPVPEPGSGLLLGLGLALIAHLRRSSPQAG